MNHKVFIICISMMVGLKSVAGAGVKPEDQLFEAAQRGSSNDLVSALERGAQIEAKDKLGYTALHWATLKGRLECLRLLIEKEAHLEAKSNVGMTALQLAAENGNLECLTLLLDNGAEIGADSYGNTALHRSALSGHPKCMRVLLARGADIEAKDVHGMTALHKAAWNGHQECLKLLIEKGAHIEEKDRTGKRALHRAGIHPTTLRSVPGYLECLKILLLAEVGLVMREMSCWIRTPAEDTVELSKRRLKVALLALRHAGSDGDGDKSKNTAGDFIVSNDYVRSWLLLSQSELREDVFIVLVDALAHGKKADYPLFRLAHNELGDYVVSRLKDALRSIHASPTLASAIEELSVVEQVAMQNLCNPDLAEENFGALIRNGIKARFNELLRNSSSY